MYVCMLCSDSRITSPEQQAFIAGELANRELGRLARLLMYMVRTYRKACRTAALQWKDICYNTAFVHPSTLWSVHQSSCNHVPGATRTAEAHSSSTETGRGRPVWLIMRPARLLLSNRMTHSTRSVKLVLNDAYDTPSFLCHLPGTAAAVVSKLRSQPLGLGTDNRCSRLD